MQCKQVGYCQTTKDLGKIAGRRPDAVLHLQGMLSPSECHWSVITVGGCLQLFILIDESAVAVYQPRGALTAPYLT